VACTVGIQRNSSRELAKPARTYTLEAEERQDNFSSGGPSKARLPAGPVAPAKVPWAVQSPSSGVSSWWKVTPCLVLS